MMTFLFGKIKNVPNHQPVIVCGKRILWCVWAISHRENDDEEDESDGMGHPICQTNPDI